MLCAVRSFGFRACGFRGLLTDGRTVGLLRGHAIFTRAWRQLRPPPIRCPAPRSCWGVGSILS